MTMQAKLCSKPLFFFIPAIIWGLVIFVVISMPPSAVPPTDKLRIPHIDKIIHFAIFFIFGALLVYGFIKTYRQKIMFLFISMVIGILYGGFTEYLQYCCFEGRHGTFADFVADSFGTVFGVLFMNIMQKFWF